MQFVEFLDQFKILSVVGKPQTLDAGTNVFRVACDSFAQHTSNLSYGLYSHETNTPRLIEIAKTGAAVTVVGMLSGTLPLCIFVQSHQYQEALSPRGDVLVRMTEWPVWLNLYNDFFGEYGNRHGISPYHLGVIHRSICTLS